MVERRGIEQLIRNSQSIIVVTLVHGTYKATIFVKNWLEAQNTAGGGGWGIFDEIASPPGREWGLLILISVGNEQLAHSIPWTRHLRTSI